MLTARARILAIAAGLFGAAAGTSLGGSLTPPTGPVAPTMKNLDQVEPRIPVNATTAPGTGTATFRISQPGSYYLTGNVTGQPGRHGILIDSGDVTLDLNGFTLIGAGGSLHGVGMIAPRDNVTVRNGQVRGWSGSGVSLQSDSGRIEGITAVSNVGAGISNSGASFMSVIRGCESRDSGGTGINAGANAVIEGCNVRIAVGAGIVTGETAAIEGCTVQDAGLEGILTGRNASVSRCAVRVSGGAGGVAAGPGSVIDTTTVTDCSGAGFNAGPGSTLTACAARDNGTAGFSLEDFATIVRCSAVGNGTGGVTLREGGVVSECLVSGNAGDGINAMSACIIRGCTVSRSAGDEIQVESDCVVSGNSCKGVAALVGSGSGVRVTGSNNRIEGNNLSDNDRGIEVGGANNIVIRNTASGNIANYQIVAGNAFGPVVIVAGVGDFAGVANGSHPAANYSY